MPWKICKASVTQGYYSTELVYTGFATQANVLENSLFEGKDPKIIYFYISLSLTVSSIYHYISNSSDDL